MKNFLLSLILTIGSYLKKIAPVGKRNVLKEYAYTVIIFLTLAPFIIVLCLGFFMGADVGYILPGWIGKWFLSSLAFASLVGLYQWLKERFAKYKSKKAL